VREYLGVKARLAQEFSGFSGSAKMFREHFELADSKQYHRYYTAEDIRRIRLKLLGANGNEERAKDLPPRINVRMAKGGTGKTTMAANIACCMAMMGHRVLLIDGDPQASLSGMFGVDWTRQEVTHIGELMRRVNMRPAAPSRIDEAIVPIYADHMLDLIPSSIEMASTDGWMAQMSLGREQAFTKLLEKEAEFFSQYDAIIIDSAPSSSLLTTSLMVASPRMLAVVMPEGQSLGALDILESNIQELNDNFPGKNDQVQIVVNRYNQTKKPHQDNLGKLVQKYGNFLNDTIVRDFVGFLRETNAGDSEASGTVLEKEPNSVGARDIIDLTKSIIKLYGVKIAGHSVRPA
jgi:chromosome partitioning protein